MSLWEPWNSTEGTDSTDLSKESPPEAEEDKPIKLDGLTMKRLRVGKVFPEDANAKDKVHIHCAAYDFGGERLMTAGADDQIVVYDCLTGSDSRAIYSKKYGVGLVSFTHACNAILHTSTKLDDTIRYLSLHDNKYIRYFSGHGQRIASLSMSPTSDVFMSTSDDGSMRLWDLRDPMPVGLMRLPYSSTPIAAFDPEGLVFAVATKKNQDVGEAKIFDMRRYEQGPFYAFKATGSNHEYVWTSMSFSPNGRSIMCCNSASQILVLDSFYGRLLNCFTHALIRFVGHFIKPLVGAPSTAGSKQNLYMDASYSPDSNFLACGGTLDGRIHVWDLVLDLKLCEFISDHSGPVNVVKFNPKYMMLATARTELAFWALPPSTSSTEELLTASA